MDGAHHGAQPEKAPDKNAEVTISGEWQRTDRTAPEFSVLDSGRVRFGGYCGRVLGEALEAAGTREIAELRIASADGNPWETLEVLRQFEGRIDHVIVEGVCAKCSACLVIPSAKRLSVASGGCILLALTARPFDFEVERLRQRDRFTSQFPTLSGEQIDYALDLALEGMRAVVERHAGFEAKNLASAEWFHPRGDTSAHWLRVTAAMARRCLKHTTVEEYCESIDESSLPVQFVSEGIERGEP